MGPFYYLYQFELFSCRAERPMNSLDECQKLLKKSVEQRNLVYIYKYIKQINALGGKSQLWKPYLVDIFLLLTISSSTFSSLQRAALISAIFKATIEITLFECDTASDPQSLSKFVTHSKMMVQSIFKETSSLNQIKQEELKMAHNCFAKFFSAICSNDINLINKPPQLQKIDKQKLLTVIPASHRRDPPTKFKFDYINLIQWYDFFSALENNIIFYCFEADIDIEISKHKQKSGITEPILKWIGGHNFLKECSMKYYQHSSNADIEYHLLRQVTSLMKDIRVNLIIYLDEGSIKKRNSPYYQNILKTMFRFNSILLCYNIVQNITSNDNLNSALATIQQMDQSIRIILLKCQLELEELKKQEQDNMFTFPLIQYERQLRWILYNLKRKHTLLQNQQFSMDRFLNQQVSFDCLIKSHGLVKKLSNKAMISIMDQRNNSNLQFSNQINSIYECQQNSYQLQLRRLGVVSKLVSLIQQSYSIHQFFKQVCAPKTVSNCFKMCISLLTKYHFNQTQLLVSLSILSKKIMDQVFSSPEAISQIYDQVQISMAALVMGLSLNPKRILYLCSNCEIIQTSVICNKCFMYCSAFIYPTIVPSFQEDWIDVITIYTQKKGEWIKKVSPTIAREIILLFQYEQLNNSYYNYNQWDIRNELQNMEQKQIDLMAVDYGK